MIVREAKGPTYGVADVPLVCQLREKPRMKIVNCSTARPCRISTKAGIGSYREAVLRIRPQWLFVVCLAIVCLVLFAARNGAQQVDSGWAVGIPSPLATGSTYNPEQDLVIRDVLEQTRKPLLRKPAIGQSSSATNGSTEGNVRFAARPETKNVEGWRAAGPSLRPAIDPSTTQSGTPPASAARAPTKRNYEFECDCNGMSGATVPKTDPG